MSKISELNTRCRLLKTNLIKYLLSEHRRYKSKTEVKLTKNVCVKRNKNNFVKH